MLLPVSNLTVLAAVKPCLAAAALTTGSGTHGTLLGLLGHDMRLGWALFLLLDLDWV